jgi:transposase
MEVGLIPCACGCGQMIPEIGSRGRPRRYVLGHHRVKSCRPDNETLRRLYADEGKSTLSIAALYGVADTTVRYWLTDARIPTRNTAQANAIAHHEKYAGPDNLADLYLQQKLTTYEIGTSLGVAPNTVAGWLRRSGIKARGRNEAKRAVSERMRPTPDELRRLYIEQEMSASEIASATAVNSGTILNWLRDAGIRVRTLSETGAISSRKRTPSRAFRKELSPRARYLILQRDNFRCCACGRSPKEHGVVLHVDHVIAVANGGGNDPANLQTLCADCNQGKSDLW